MLSNQDISNKIKVLENAIALINGRLDGLTKILESTIRISDLVKSETALKDLIKSTNGSISTLEQKLSTVILPDDTRFYLNEDEIQNFRTTVQQLSAMMASFDQLYKNLVAYTANNK